MMKEQIATPAMAAHSGAELVQRCLHGDAGAWRILVERYARLVHSIPARQGFTPAEVEDVGQEVFLALAQNLHMLEDAERLPAWLVTTTRRACWRLNARRRHEQSFDDLAGEGDEDSPTRRQPASPLPTPEEALEGWNRQQTLRQALDQMGDRCRQLLTLLFLDPDEPGYEEISARIGMAKGSIGPTRNRCLQQLRALLPESDDT